MSEPMTAKQKLDALDNGLLALVAHLSDPLLDGERIPNARDKVILRVASKRLERENVYFRQLLKLRAELVKEHFRDLESK